MLQPGQHCTVPIDEEASAEALQHPALVLIALGTGAALLARRARASA